MFDACACRVARGHDIGRNVCVNCKRGDKEIKECAFKAYPQNIVLPIPIIAIHCQLKLIAGLEKRQSIAVSPTII
jgi:hypothetical protein